MRSHRMRGYGAWCQGWRDAERLPNGPPQPPGLFFWCIIGIIVFACIQTALQGYPFALLLGLALVAGALKRNQR